MMLRTCRTVLALPVARRRLLVEAFALVAAVRIGLHVLPFTTVRRYVRRWADQKSNDGCQPGDVVWAIDAIGSRVHGTTCLVEALSADCMLRRRGHAPELKIGVRRGAVMSIDAHAWVECSGAVVIGTTPELTEYAVLSGEPPAPAGRRDAVTEGTTASRRLPARLYGVLRRATGPPHWRAACLYLGAGLLSLRQLRDASIIRWEAYGTAESNVADGLEDWEAKVYREVLRPSDRVLLVGCGTGRDLIELAKLGCAVVGLEQSPMLADEARAHLRTLGLEGVVVATPVESYVTDSTSDAVVFSLYMYSYIIGAASRIAVLTRVRDHLSRGGRIILSYATLQPQSHVWISLARISSVCSGSDWWPHRGDRLHGPSSQPELLNLEHQFSPDEIADECRAAGLRVIRDEAINPLFRFAIAAV